MMESLNTTSYSSKVYDSVKNLTDLYDVERVNRLNRIALLFLCTRNNYFVTIIVSYGIIKDSGCSSGVERNLAKVDVARSNRVTR
jgi:hypothetical protein